MIATFFTFFLAFTQSAILSRFKLYPTQVNYFSHLEGMPSALTFGTGNAKKKI